MGIYKAVIQSLHDFDINKWPDFNNPIDLDIFLDMLSVYDCAILHSINHYTKIFNGFFNSFSNLSKC